MYRFLNCLKKCSGARARVALPCFLVTAFLAAPFPIRVFAEVGTQVNGDTEVRAAPTPEPAIEEGGQGSAEPLLDDGETPILSDAEIEALIDAITELLDTLSGFD